MTFIIPVYNAEKYLKECLESILKQNIPKEIICINDGSTDKSLTILKAFATQYAEIKIIDKENEGVAIARNIGIENANGKYLWFVDSDDYLLCENLRYFCELAEKYQTPIVRGTIYRNHMDYVIRYRSNFKEVDTAFLEERTLNFVEDVAIYLESGLKIGHSPKIWSGFYSTEFIKENKIKFPNISTSEDDIFELNCFTAKMGINILETTCPFYFYRDTKNSLSKEKLYQRIKNLIAVMPDVERILDRLLQESTKSSLSEKEVILSHILIKVVNFIYHKMNRYALLELFKMLDKDSQEKVRKEIPKRYIIMLRETLLTLISIPNNNQFFGRYILEDIENLWGDFLKKNLYGTPL